MRIDIAHDFCSTLSTDHWGPTRGGILFRQKYLSRLDSVQEWVIGSFKIELDFKGVKSILPSFIVDAFCYFLKYTTKDQIFSRIKFLNMSKIQSMQLDLEFKQLTEVSEPVPKHKACRTCYSNLAVFSTTDQQYCDICQDTGLARGELDLEVPATKEDLAQVANYLLSRIIKGK